jgi:hypothetical protein
MMEAARTSETSVDIQLRTRQYIPEDSEFQMIIYMRVCDILIFLDVAYMLRLRCVILLFLRMRRFFIHYMKDLGKVCNDNVTNSQVLFHDGTLLHSQFNTQLLITVHNSSRIRTRLQLLSILEYNSQITLRKSQPASTRPISLPSSTQLSSSLENSLFEHTQNHCVGPARSRNTNSYKILPTGPLILTVTKLPNTRRDNPSSGYRSTFTPQRHLGV